MVTAVPRIHNGPLSLRILFSKAEALIFENLMYSWTRHIGFLVFWAMCSAATAQQSYWTGEVVDAESGQALIGANVVSLLHGHGTISDSRGEFALPRRAGVDSIRISYVGYVADTLVIDSKKPPKRVALRIDTRGSTVATIVAEAKPKKVTPKFRSISDFIMLNDRILAVESSGNLSKAKLQVLDLEGQILTSTALASFPLFDKLYRSCRGTPYILTEYWAYELMLENNEVVVAHRSSIDDFKRYVAPCAAITAEHLYHKSTKLGNQLGQVTKISLDGYSREILDEVYDPARKEDMMAYMRDLGDFSSLLRKPREQINKNFIRIIKMEENNIAMLAGHPVHFDVMAQGETVMVFDHEEHRIRTFDTAGELQLDVPVYYQDDQWRGDLIQDQKTQNIYVLIYEGSKVIIHLLHVQSGELEFVKWMHHDFIDELKIHDGTIWYTSASLIGDKSKRLHKANL